MMEDEHGRGESCEKCGKIVYIIIFNEYPLGDTWRTNGTTWHHTNCENTLAMSGKFKMIEHLPLIIHNDIKRLEKELVDIGMDEPSNPDTIMPQINRKVIEHTLNILKHLIPTHTDGIIAKSCQVKES